MPRLNNPIVIEITRNNGRLITIDIIPVYVEQHHAFVATDDLRLYEGYPPENRDLPEDIEQRERYLDYLDAQGAENPSYLGLLRYQPGRTEHWSYNGDRLTAFELQQIVATLESYAPDTELEEAAIQSILDEKETADSFSFVYNNGFRTDVIRVEATDGPFLIFINEELSAEVEQRGGHWALIAGHIEDPELLLEITGRIGHTGSDI